MTGLTTGCYLCDRYPDVELLKKGVRVLMDRQMDNGDFPVVSQALGHISPWLLQSGQWLHQSIMCAIATPEGNIHMLCKVHTYIHILCQTILAVSRCCFVPCSV